MPGKSGLLEFFECPKVAVTGHRDHLGSIDVITDPAGNIKQRSSFDPWGRRRNPADWSYENVPGDSFIDMGFTGHEHLDQFGLINMNGRVYDPLMAMFLSPDNFIQSPDFTQNYNRYTYCLNNPLKYFDPSGYKRVPDPPNDEPYNFVQIGRPRFKFEWGGPQAAWMDALGSGYDKDYSTFSKDYWEKYDNYQSGGNGSFTIIWDIKDYNSDGTIQVIKDNEGNILGVMPNIEIINYHYSITIFSDPQGGGDMLLSPVDNKYSITSPYIEGNRVIPELGINRPHLAIDIGTPNGTPIRSPWSGKIVMAQNTEYGLSVIIKHDYQYNGQYIQTGYAHLSEMNVTNGLTINRGFVIGYTGTWGTGPHLHFTLRIGDRKVNPTILFPYK